MKRPSPWPYSVAILTRRAIRVFWLSLCALALLAPSVTAQTTRSSGAVQTNQLRSVSDSTAAEMEVAALGNALTNRMQEVALRTGAVESVFKLHQVVLTTFTVLLVLMVLA